MYGKIFRQMYQGTLATKGPWQALVTFQQLLVLADSDGVVDMTPEFIARETTIPLDIIRQGLAELEKPDPGSRTPDEEGRRIVLLDDHRDWGWRITNYVKYRSIKREEDRREYQRQYWHKRKAHKSTAQTGTQHNSTNQPIEEAEAEAEAEAKADNTPPPPEGVKPPKRSRSQPAPKPEGVSQQVWGDFLALRTRKRAPVTLTVMQGAELEAAKAGLSLEEFLSVWCRRGSQGLEAAWLKPEERGHGRPQQDDRKSRQLQTAALMTGSTRATEPECIDVPSRIVP